MTGVVGAVLAGGRSSRLGVPKQLVRVDGEPLVVRAARALADGGACRVAVVVGASARGVAAALAGLGVEVLFNARWHEGMGSSVAVAARWATALGAPGLLLTTCDQAALDRLHARDLLQAFVTTERRVASGYAGVAGVPAVFPASDFAALARREGDEGARALLRGGGDVLVGPWEVGAQDLDSPGDLARLECRAARPIGR